MFWNKPKRPKGLSSEQWVTEHAARNSPDWEAEQSYRDVNPLTVGQVGEFTHDHGYVFTQGPNGTAVAVPNTPMTFTQTQQWTQWTNVGHAPVPGTVVQAADGLKMWTGSTWRPWVEKMRPEQINELTRPMDAEVMKALVEKLEEPAKPPVEKFHFKSF